LQEPKADLTIYVDSSTKDHPFNTFRNASQTLSNEDGIIINPKSAIILLSNKLPYPLDLGYNISYG